jgi:hypothetical protein
MKGLTSVFGMGTGVSPSLWAPNKQFLGKNSLSDAQTRAL